MTYTNRMLESVRDASTAAAGSAARRDSTIAAALLEGERQADVADVAGISQSAVSQMMRRRRAKTIGSRWTIPVLAAVLQDRPEASMNEVVRACARGVH